MKYLAIKITKMRRHIAAFVILCFLSCFLWAFYTVNVSASEMTGTEILSIIPFIEREDDGIWRNVPIESWDDIQALNTRNTQLRIQVRISEEDAQRFRMVFIHRLRTFEPVTAVRAENIAGSFDVINNTEFTHNQFVLSDLSNLNNGEIYNKFVLSVSYGDGFIPISSARYIDNINHLANRNDTPPVARSIKGLTSIQLPGEARLLGVQHTTVTMVLNDIMAAEPGTNTEAYMFGGEEFFFNMDVISEYDRLISYFTNEGIKVTAVLVISANDYIHPSQREDSDTILPIDRMIHRGALQNPSASPFNFGINTADEYEFKYFAALMSFIAGRYVQSNVGNGRIYNVILGNSIGNIFMNYCGQIDIEQYVQDYLRALRIADTAMRSRFGGARVYVPFDNWFAAKPDDDDGFVNRDIIDLLSAFSVAEGNFPWNVAVNAFNARISNLRSWTESEPTHEFDTPFITTSNIEILRDYLNVVLRDYQYNGQPRMIMLANQGFSSGGSGDSEGDELQAASFIYAYVRARAIPEITAFIYHSQMDNPREAVGYFGLRTEAGEPKLIRDVFRDMDTNKEYRHLPILKTLMGIENLSAIMPHNTEVSDTAPAVILTEAVGQSSRSHMSFRNIGRFNNADLDGFIGSINMGDISFMEYEDEYSNFSQGLAATFTAPRRGDFGSISRIFESENYLDLSESNFVGVNLRIDSDLNLYENHSVQIVLTLESPPDHLGSTHIYEGIARIRLNEDTTVFFDISGWDARENIQRLSLAANPYAHERNYERGGYHFLMFVESIVGANVSRMTIVQIIIRIIWITALVLFLLWLALFIRARMIKIRRRKRKMQQQQRRRQALRRQAQMHRQFQLPPPNSQSQFSPRSENNR